jgi:hypothetical protein
MNAPNQLPKDQEARLKLTRTSLFDCEAKSSGVDFAESLLTLLIDVARHFTRIFTASFFHVVD